MKIEMNYISDSTTLKQVYKAVFLRNLNNPKLSHKITNYLSIKGLLNQHQSLSRSQINNILNRLKYSGFFSRIKVSPVSIYGRNYLVIYFKLNSILRKINVVDSCKLQIPNKYLSYLLSRQMGYPQNFVWINNIIREILFWYFMRGYKWARVILNYTGNNNEELNIKILEGKIYKIKLICVTTKTNNIKYFNSLIMRELHILPNEILNIKQVEAGILGLKSKKILLSCNYNVAYVNNSNLEITVKYRQTEDKETFILSKNWNISDKLYHLLGERLHYLFNNMIRKRFLVYHLPRIENLVHIHLRLYPFIYPVTSLHDMCFNNYIIPNFMYAEEFLNFWSLRRNFFYSTHTFEFKQYIYNLSKYLNNLTIDLQFDKLYPIIHLSYSHNKLQLNKNYQLELVTHLFQDRQKVKINILPTILEKVKYKKLYSNKFIYANGLDLTAKYRLYKSAILLTKIGIVYNWYNEALIYRNYQWQKLNILLNTKGDYSILEEQKVWITKRYLNYILNYKYNTLNIKKTLIAGKLLRINSRHTLALQEQNIQLKHIQKIRSSFHVQYTQVINISKKTLKKLSKYIIIDIEINQLSKKMKYTPTNNHYVSNYFSLIYYHSQHLIVRFCKLYNINLEYHIPFKYNSTLFCNINYFKEFCTPHKTICIITDVATVNGEYLLKHFLYNISLGAGLQINFPIKQLPPLKFRYSITLDKQRKFCVKLFFK
uniref:POTRA domain-containing protein n=1 Tax=Renouxia sp. TaxID=2485823 RepID=A0A3G3MHI4_9FLOR|nr:hypothetical protein [Renouxia sp.]